MLELAERQAVGPYLLTRALEPASIGERFLALHSDDHSSHVAYRLPACGDREAIRLFVEAVRMCEAVRQEHLLAVEYHTIDADGHPWVVSPFTGDVDGIRTLTKLLREKGGQMNPAEAERAVEQVLEASAFAHRTEPARDGKEARVPVAHGPITMDEILVDRHGRVVIELYGLARLLRAGQDGGPVSPTAARGGEVIRDELRCIAQIAYQLITGLRAEEPMIPAGRLVKRLDPRWDRWLARGLDAAAGFDTAAEALAALPSRCPGEAELEPAGGVRSVLGRLRPGRW